MKKRLFRCQLELLRASQLQSDENALRGEQHVLVSASCVWCWGALQPTGAGVEVFLAKERKLRKQAVLSYVLFECGIKLKLKLKPKSKLKLKPKPKSTLSRSLNLNLKLKLKPNIKSKSKSKPHDHQDRADLVYCLCRVSIFVKWIFSCRKV